MNEDLLGEVALFQRRAASLRARLERAQAAAGQPAAGTDRSGAVTIRLATDGVPASAEVAETWLRTLGPQRFTAAVVEAANVAAAQRLTWWAEAMREPHRGQGQTAAPHSPHVPWSAPDATAGQQVRAASSVAEDMLAALRNVDDLATRSPLVVQGVGLDPGRKIKVTVSGGGLVACQAAPRWLPQQSGAALTRALNQALTTARAALDRARRAPSPTNELDQLFAEAMAILTQPPHAEPGGR
jgi:hypothetical protein